ncbi:hypothetical protein HPB50_006549 [Hyalomma asiaticum]|uniref:Uncharacterized protein n=1 Tax=Hyalomma asiaticum TaxID=266040 RepID=A0ACB7T3A7_HYAAI|nr:hypothetical protein HPB50_006549 [Hyalomma asiaticum]
MPLSLSLSKEPQCLEPAAACGRRARGPRRRRHGALRPKKTDRACARSAALAATVKSLAPPLSRPPPPHPSAPRDRVCVRPTAARSLLPPLRTVHFFSFPSLVAGQARRGAAAAGYRRCRKRSRGTRWFGWVLISHCLSSSWRSGEDRYCARRRRRSLGTARRSSMAAGDHRSPSSRRRWGPGLSCFGRRRPYSEAAESSSSS